MERKQDRREKTEKGQTKTEKKRFTPPSRSYLGLTTSFSPGTGLFSVGFPVLSFFRLSLLIPVPSSCPLARDYERLGYEKRCHNMSIYSMTCASEKGAKNKNRGKYIRDRPIYSCPQNAQRSNSILVHYAKNISAFLASRIK
jgi:hypothetical protein